MNLHFRFLCLVYNFNQVRHTSDIKNISPSTTVILCKTNSAPLTFCFPNSSSAPPVNPDNPPDLLSCNKTTTINRILLTIANTLYINTFFQKKQIY